MLAVGDLLRFSLRANATRAYKKPGASRGQRADVVMAALAPLPPEERAVRREALIQEAGAAWLQGQAEKNGFALEGTVHVDGYEQLKLKRNGAADIRFSCLDFEGVLRVTDTPAFTGALARGFGHARTFGCGLMLIRRA